MKKYFLPQEHVNDMVSRLGPVISKAVWSVRPLPHLSEDLVQDAWVALLEGGYSGQEVPNALSYKIARNTAVDSLSTWTGIPQRTYAKYLAGATSPKTSVRIHWRMNIMPLEDSSQEMRSKIFLRYRQSEFPPFPVTIRFVSTPRTRWNESEAADLEQLAIGDDPGGDIRRRRRTRKNVLMHLPFDRSNQYHTRQYQDADSYSRRFLSEREVGLPEQVQESFSEPHETVAQPLNDYSSGLIHDLVRKLGLNPFDPVNRGNSDS